jgi:hypothetical protein
MSYALLLVLLASSCSCFYLTGVGNCFVVGIAVEVTEAIGLTRDDLCALER